MCTSPSLQIFNSVREKGNGVRVIGEGKGGEGSENDVRGWGRVMFQL